MQEMREQFKAEMKRELRDEIRQELINQIPEDANLMKQVLSKVKGTKSKKKVDKTKKKKRVEEEKKEPEQTVGGGFMKYKFGQVKKTNSEEEKRRQSVCSSNMGGQDSSYTDSEMDSDELAEEQLRQSYENYGKILSDNRIKKKKDRNIKKL